MKASKLLTTISELWPIKGRPDPTGLVSELFPWTADHAYHVIHLYQELPFLIPPPPHHACMHDGKLWRAMIKIPPLPCSLSSYHPSLSYIIQAQHRSNNRQRAGQPFLYSWLPQCFFGQLIHQFIGYIKSPVFWYLCFIKPTLLFLFSEKFSAVKLEHGACSIINYTTLDLLFTTFTPFLDLRNPAVIRYMHWFPCWITIDRFISQCK